MKLNSLYNSSYSNSKLKNNPLFISKAKSELFTNSNPDLFVSEFLKNNLLDGMSLEEYQQIRRNAVSKTVNILGGCVLTGAVLFIGGMCALKSGKFDKQINKILSSDNKFIVSFREAINSKVKREIAEKLDFSSAKSHFHNIGTKNGQISGAHEIRECIQTLISEKGKIYDIKQSKTQNGLWEILYEINGKRAEASKTVYISAPLTDNDAKNLFALCSNYVNRSMLQSIGSIVNEKSICDISKMELAVETALKEGFLIKTKGLENSAFKAKKDIISLTNSLKLKTNDYNLAEQNVAQLKDELKELKKIVAPSSEEFQSKVKELKGAKQVSKQLKSECDSLESSISRTKEHYNHVKNSINIFGEKDGKLFAAYAHYENNKIVVDSYFPITHGCGLHSEFVDHCLDERLLSLNNIKCLIGAKESQINRFFLQLGKKFTNWFKSNSQKVFQGTSFTILAGSEVIATSDIKKNKKEAKKI